ncbi:MAG: N-acetylglucosamine kinase [Streptosporangiaceae bacterium]
MEHLVVGVDAGGSYTRALVADASGNRVSDARASGANPISRGLAEMETALTEALRPVLSAVDPGRVRHGVVAMAGNESVGEGRVASSVEDVWRGVGLACPYDVVSDVAGAFAAGTCAEDGVVVVAGTGAVAGLVRGGRLVRVVDGYGWLVGDDGSAFWLGREAVKAVLAALDGRGASTDLVRGVTGALDAPMEPRALTERVYRKPPLALAELAPLVSEAAAAGDEVASELVEKAAESLLSAVEALRPAGLRRAVLAGGVLTSEGPLSGLVRDGVRARFHLVPSVAADGAVGAAALAIRAYGADLTPEAHARLTAG